MDLKSGCIDGCEVETIYPVNTVTAKTAHYNLFVSNASLGKGRQLQVVLLEEMWNRGAQGPAAVGMAAGGDPQLGTCTCTFYPC